MKQKKQKRKYNKYQISVRIAVIAVLLFFITLSFGLELLFSRMG